MWHRETGEGTDQGATLVEYAVVAPFLFLLLFGIVEFALLTASFTGVWTSAREGARYATTVGDSTVTPGTPRYLDCDGIRVTARGLVSIGEPTNAEITVDYFDPLGAQIADCDTADVTFPTPTESTIPSGSTVAVTITKEYQAIVPLLGQFIDGITFDSTQSRSIHRGVVGGN
ncbi:MAG: TadE family protein [Acidimicrobiia bacterium]